MRLKTNTDRYFRSSSFPLAAFLCAKGEQIIDINLVDATGKKEFIFVKTSTLEELIYKYKFGSKDDPNIFVSVHAYEYARRELLDRLND